MSGFASKIDDFFQITSRGSSFRTEIKGGLITFLAMFYILAVNPLIVSVGAGIELFDQLMAATALSAGISCLLMGLYARFPVALAPGMGINVFITYTVVISLGFSYPQALMIVLLSGVMFFILTVTGLRAKILNDIPSIIKKSVTTGIGFFIVTVALYNSGLIEQSSFSALELGQVNSPGVLLSLFCIAVTLALWFKNHWAAVLIGMISTVIIGCIGSSLFGWSTLIDGAEIVPSFTILSEGVVTMPDFGLIGAVFLDFGNMGAALIPSFIVCLISLTVIDVFDTAGTLMGVGTAAGILDEEGRVIGGEKALKADAAATVIGAAVGATTTTSFIESNAGIASGARTGLMAVVVGLLFLASLFFAPIFSVVTSACTVGALVLVGIMMMSPIKDIDWTNPLYAATGFMTIFMMGLSGSITNGIAFGTFAYMIGMICARKYFEVPKAMRAANIIFLLYFLITYFIEPMLEGTPTL